MDPAGFAPASSGDNTDMLLHTPRARVHFHYKKEKTLAQGSFLATRLWPVCRTMSVSVISIAEQNGLSRPI